MKKGFTLAEALLTLSIIGVVAALTLPMIHRVKPDEYKVKYLKAYDAISETVQMMVSSSREYPACGTLNINGTDYDVDFSEAPFLNTNQGITGSISEQNGFSGIAKFCRLFAWQLDTSGDVTCSNALNPSIAPNLPGNQWIRSFDTQGVEFSVTLPILDQNLNNNGSHFAANISIDVDSTDNGGDCYYWDNNCTKPDRFWIQVGVHGEVVAADQLGQAYIQTRNNLTQIDYAQYINANNIQRKSYAGQGGTPISETLTLCQ